MVLSLLSVAEVVTSRPYSPFAVSTQNSVRTKLDVEPGSYRGYRPVWPSLTETVKHPTAVRGVPRSSLFRGAGIRAFCLPPVNDGTGCSLSLFQLIYVTVLEFYDK